MKSYTYSEAREKFATVLRNAAREGMVEVRQRDGKIFRILPIRESKTSPLAVKGVKLRLSTADLVTIVRKQRERG
ncbi:MAG TPA: hypothetical protein VGG14_09665 [Candidatus Sulfotelmatobacter sp.]|jgi:antitoxin (DNA-binding transcriptional repressor) of toxin-antitoxin stability system